MAHENFSLVTPFIGKHPNQIIKWTNHELEGNRQFIYKNQGVKNCFKGRIYMLRAAAQLSTEAVIDLVSLPSFTLMGPLVRTPAVICKKCKTIKVKTYIEETELFSAKKVLLLAIRTVFVALAALATLVIGVFISACLAIKIQEQLRILNKLPEKLT